MYPFFDNKNVIITGFMVPLILFFFFNIIITYFKNNFYFVEDIDGINRNIDAHNKRVNILKKKARDLRNKIMSEGPEAVYGEENGRLVQKVMDMEVARRKAIKLAKELEGQEDPEQDKYEAQKTGQFGRSITTNYRKAKGQGSPQAKNSGNQIAPASPSVKADQVVDISAGDADN